MKKDEARLGKGLGAIFGEDLSNVIEEIQQGDETRQSEIKLSEIRPNPYQPRKIFDDAKIGELAQSIKEHGVFTPVLLRKSVKGYELIAGERRVRASKQAGLKTIPAIVMEFTDEQMMEISLLENIQREDLNAIEEAQAYLQEINAYAMDERKKEFCADPYLNAVLQQYSDRFLKLGAQWEYVLKYQSFPLTHAETCLIFSNALENCCDALQALPPALREVSVQTDIQQNYALIRIKNRCGQKLQLTPHQLPPSCKKDSGHGLGLTTIQDIAQRQGGNIHCSVENGWFILDVMLKLEPVCDPQASADTTLA